MTASTTDEAAGRAPELEALPLVTLVRAYLDGVTSLVEITDPALGLDLRLDLDSSGSGGTSYRRAGPAAWLPRTSPDAAGPGGAPQAPGNGVEGPRLDVEGPPLDRDTLAVISAGPDPAGQIPVEVLGHFLGHLPEGAHALLLFGFPPAQLPGHQILSLLADSNCLILQVAAVDEANFSNAIVVTRVAGLAAARPGAADGDPALRNVNEYALSSFVAQGLQARLADLERAGATEFLGSGTSAEQPEDGAEGAQAGAALERDRLARALRSTQRELVGVYEKLMTLERSTSLEVGRAVVGMAQRPWREGVRLPIGLYKLWRDRRGAAVSRRPGGKRPDTALTLLQDRGGPGLGDRWLAAYTTPGQMTAGSLEGTGRLVITGALTSLSCATLEPDAVVHPLLPHDADFVLEGTGADMVVIETAAMLPGASWAYACDPAATDRGRRLAALAGLARSLGKPVVLLRNTPWHLTVGLDWLASISDAVVDGDLGVQLARFNPIGLDPGRPCDAVYAAGRDPREPAAARRILDELTRAGGPVTVAGQVRWRSAPARYREHGLFVAANDAQAREQLAAGARVVGPVGHPVAAAGCVPAPEAARAAVEIEASREAGPRGPAEIRPVLRDLFENHATPTRLAGLARLLGLPADAAASRQVAVLADLPDASHAQRLGHDLMRQRLQPAEVIVSLGGQHPQTDGAAIQRQAAVRALRALTDSGVVVRVTAGPGLPAAAAARSPWVAPWDPDREHPDHYLLDLACALECSRADAVGHASGDDYVFTRVIEPALARRILMVPDAPPPDAWGRQGLSMLSICP